MRPRIEITDAQACSPESIVYFLTALLFAENLY